jgi:hypothetical protein
MVIYIYLSTLILNIVECVSVFVRNFERFNNFPDVQATCMHRSTNDGACKFCRSGLVISQADKTHNKSLSKEF